VRHVPAGGRHAEDVLQGGLDAAFRGPADLHPGPGGGHERAADRLRHRAHHADLGVADLNIGILFFFAMAGLTVYAVLFAGWSSANKFALLGALRASAQTLSYEVFLGLSLMGI